MTGFCIKLPTEMTTEQSKALSVFMDEVADANNYEAETISKQIGCSLACAYDIQYLRTRTRHTPELEAELIHLHHIGTPPNMCEFDTSCIAGYC